MTKERFRKCINMILSPIAPNQEDLADESFLELNQEAGELYGMIHSRYIYSTKGMAKIFAKFLSAGYGYCPRTLCDK
jgi:casein kinase II subunit beta